jgi:hypothetical protein
MRPFRSCHTPRIMGRGGGDVTAPVVHVSSCAVPMRDIMTGDGKGVFQPNAKCKHIPNAKAHLPGFCITLRRYHFYNTALGARHIEPARAYHAFFSLP